MNRACQQIFRLTNRSLMVVTVLVTACSASVEPTITTQTGAAVTTSSVSVSSTTVTSTSESTQPTPRETLVRSAIEAMFAGDSEGLLSRSLVQDVALLEAIDDSQAEGSTLVDGLTRVLVLAFGPQGSDSLIVDEGPEDGGWAVVEVRSGRQGAGLSVMIDTATEKIDLIATFAAYIATDLELAATSSPLVAEQLSRRSASLEVADRLAFEPLRDDQAAMDRLLLLAGAE